METLSMIAAAIVTLAPRLNGETVDRYAADIAAATDDIDQALAMVVVQDAESSWRPEVENCTVTGDGNRALTMWQFHAHWMIGLSRKDVCSSNRLAAYVAGNALQVLNHRTGGWRGAIRAYVGARPGDPRIVSRLRKYEMLLKRARQAQSS